MDGGVGGGAAQGDEGPGQQGEGQELPGALLRLGHPSGGITLQKFLGGKVMQGSTPFKGPQCFRSKRSRDLVVGPEPLLRPFSFYMSISKAT